MLDKGDQQMLDQLMANEQWYSATEAIEAVRVVSVDSIAKGSEAPEDAQLAIAVEDRDGAYVLAWSGHKVFDDWVFSAAASTNQERARASEWDGSAPWAGAGMAGFDQLLAGNEEVRNLLTKVMTDPRSLTMEDLLRLRELLAELGAPPTATELVDQEIAKREDRGRDEGEGTPGGGGGGGGGDSPRPPPTDPGPGPGGPGPGGPG